MGFHSVYVVLIDAAFPRTAIVKSKQKRYKMVADEYRDEETAIV